MDSEQQINITNTLNESENDMNKLVIVLLCVFTHSTTHAQDNCDLRLDRADTNPTIGSNSYDVFNSVDTNKRFDIELVRLSEGLDCQTRLVLTPEGQSELRNNSARLDYRLRPVTDDGILVNESLIFSRNDPAIGEPIRLTYDMVIESEQFVAPGTYSQMFLLELFDTTNDNEVLLEERRLTLSIDVEPAARIFLLGVQGRSQVADFGELRDGATVNPSPQLVVQSTGQYDLVVNSENNGFLRHNSENEQWDIEYLASLGDENVNLGEDNAINFSQATTRNGLQLPLRLTVPRVQNRPAGTYTDTIRIEISPSLRNI